MAQYVQENEQVMSTEDLLQAQIELYHHCLAFIKSMALRAATDLRIPDAIHHNGGAATLSDLAVRVGLHPTKLSHLRRLMRVLTLSGIFTVVHDRDGEATYTLTRVSRLLLSDGVERTHGLSQMVRVFVNPVAVASQFSIHEWFTVEQAAAVSLFEVAHGCTRWEMIANDAKDGSMFNAGMVEDSSVAMDIILRKSGNVFQGINSLVDVGGGYGAVAAAVARAFPDIKCTVLDLPHIVAKAPTNNNIQFIGGDLFEFIPAADVVLLKCILHCWQHDDCVKILRRCKEAISARDAGGKVILIEVVVGIGSNETVPKEMQLLFDVFMMYTDGIEREEHEWKKIFLEAGFSDYKITPVLGVRSIIEVYP